MLAQPYTIDLKNLPSDTIVNTLEDMELTPLLFRMRIDPAQFLQDE